MVVCYSACMVIHAVLAIYRVGIDAWQVSHKVCMTDMNSVILRSPLFCDLSVHTSFCINFFAVDVKIYTITKMHLYAWLTHS